VSLRTYYLDKRLANGIVKLFANGYRDLWTRGRIRGRDKRCMVTGSVLKSGMQAWRPITNGNNRMDRISDAGIAQLESIAAVNPPK
jgi:hypothetical protein